MASIRREIEVEAPPDEVAAMWSRFIEWVRVGSGRLTCDELACVDAVRAGYVEFGESRDRHTVVSFILPLDDEGPSEDALERRMRRDLIVFKDYVERAGAQERRSASKNPRGTIKADKSALPRATRADGTESGDRVAYSKHFPT